MSNKTSNLNLHALREDTPGCTQVIHFNNAGAALPPRSVVNTVKNHLDLEASIGGYEAAHMKQAELDDFYIQASQLIHCTPQEIAFTENATRAWDMAFYSLPFKAGDRIVTAISEYASNYLAFLQLAKHKGILIDVIPNDKSGQLDINQLQARINDRVKLIAITHVPTQGGLINPAKQVGEIASYYQIPYLLDTTQSLGQMPIDVREIACDFLCATGRKFLRGPRGTGFLYARKEMLLSCEPPFIDLHAATWTNLNTYQLRSDAKRFETWEQNYAAKLGLKEAIRYAQALGLPAIWQRIQSLSTLLRSKLARFKEIQLQDLGEQQCGIISFTVANKKAETIHQELAKQKINVSVSLQEYARLDLMPRHLSALVRASVHYYNSEEEIDLFCAALEQTIRS